MRRFLRPGMAADVGLFGIWLLLARPAAGGAVEAAPGGVVGGFLHGAENGSLEGAGEKQPAPADVAVLRVGRLLLVDEPPELVEDLLPHDPCEQTGPDRDGEE